MNKQQIDIFYDMACLFEYVGELEIDDTASIDDIQKLYGNDEFNAINILFNEEGYGNANDAFKEVFGIDIERLNDLADEFGFERIKDEQRSN